MSADWALTAPTDGKLQAYVWWCGDEYCDCSEAHIEHVTPNPLDRRWVDRKTLWSGKFYTDGEPDATTELNREARRLRKDHNELFHRISWPWNRSEQ